MEKFKFKDGIYEGEAIDEIPNGKGLWILGEDCGYYEGNFVDGVPHGKGTLFAKGIATFEGDWVNGAFTGEGKIILPPPDDIIEEGTFVNMELIRGKRIYKDGEIHEGEFSNGKLHGEGKLTRLDGTIIDGTWENGEFINIEIPYTWNQ